jgi:hypothetical protein
LFERCGDCSILSKAVSGCCEVLGVVKLLRWWLVLVADGEKVWWLLLMVGGGKEVRWLVLLAEDAEMWKLVL